MCIYLVSDEEVGDLGSGHALLDVVVDPGPGRFGADGEADDLLVGHADNQADPGVIERSDDLLIIVEDFDMLDANALDQLRDVLGPGKVVAEASIVDP